MQAKILNVVLFFLIGGLCWFCSSFTNPHLWTLLRWDIMAGQNYWEFATASFAHFTNQHLYENLIGLFFIWWFFFGENCGSILHKIFAIIVPAFAVTIGIYFFTDTSEYTGLSGALHGTAVAAAFSRWITDKDWKGIVAVIIIFIKIYVDYYHPEFGFDAIARKMYGSNFQFTELGNKVNNIKNFYVSAPSHFIGALAGLVLGAIYIVIYKRGPHS